MRLSVLSDHIQRFQCVIKVGKRSPQASDWMIKVFRSSVSYLTYWAVFIYLFFYLCVIYIFEQGNTEIPDASSETP